MGECVEDMFSDREICESKRDEFIKHIEEVYKYHKEHGTLEEMT